jgi:hypothetical protein
MSEYQLRTAVEYHAKTLGVWLRDLRFAKETDRQLKRPGAVALDRQLGGWAFDAVCCE